MKKKIKAGRLYLISRLIAKLQNIIESLEIDPQIYEQKRKKLVFGKGAKEIQRRKDSLFNNSC